MVQDKNVLRFEKLAENIISIWTVEILLSIASHSWEYEKNVWKWCSTFTFAILSAVEDFRWKRNFFFEYTLHSMLDLEDFEMLEQANIYADFFFQPEIMLHTNHCKFSEWIAWKRFSEQFVWANWKRRIWPRNCINKHMHGPLPYQYRCALYFNSKNSIGKQIHLMISDCWVWLQQILV